MKNLKQSLLLIVTAKAVIWLQFFPTINRGVNSCLEEMASAKYALF